MSEPADKQSVKMTLVEKDANHEAIYQQLISHPENFTTDEFDYLTTHVYKDRFDFESIMALFTLRVRRKPSQSILFKKTFLATLEGNHQEFDRLYNILILLCHKI